MRKQSIGALICAGLVGASLFAGTAFAADGAKAGDAAKQDAAAAEQTEKMQRSVVLAQDENSVTVIDGGGREVTIELPVDTVVSVYALSYLLAFDMDGHILNGNSKAINLMIDPTLAEGATIMESGQINVEALASLDPDLFIHRSDSYDLYDSLEAVGVTAIGVYSEDVEEIKATLNLLGAALGKPERGQELAEYFEGIMDRAAGLVADIPESERHTAILMGSSLGKVAHGDMLQSVMIETAGGVNLARDVESDGIWPVVGVEQIFEWDPEFIFLRNASLDYTIEDLKADPAWADLTAVKNDHVYMVPCDMDSWEFPCLQTALGTMWMVSVMYPDLMTADEFDEVVADFYQFVYGIEVDRELLDY